MVMRKHKYADGGKIVKERPPVKAKETATPGVKGAIKDAVGAIGKAVAPKAITQRKSRIDQALEDAGA